MRSTSIDAQGMRPLQGAAGDQYQRESAQGGAPITWTPMNLLRPKCLRFPPRKPCVGTLGATALHCTLFGVPKIDHLGYEQKPSFHALEA